MQFGEVTWRNHGVYLSLYTHTHTHIFWFTLPSLFLTLSKLDFFLIKFTLILIHISYHLILYTQKKKLTLKLG